ncbi:MAG: TIGR02147 family protein [Chitinivibrionales bacterium]|nr:TIGR02147 family protein [Chitinivibrionales bacterium]
MNSVYEYLDYRDYLKDFYEEQKRKRPLYFSYRYIGNRIGIDSSYLAKVIAKKNHISMVNALKICPYLKLSDREAHYFTLLIKHAKAKTETDRTYFLEQISVSRRLSIESFDMEKQQLFRNWYTFVIWELTHYLKIANAPEEFVRKLIPPITQQEAAEAIKLLKRLKFVELREDGTLKALSKLLFVNDTDETAIVHNLKRQVTILASEALDRFPKEEQISNHVMVSLSEKSLALIRRRVQALVKKILKLADCDQNKRRVYYFAFHGFPTTTSEH